jgi:hypothetical protein
LEQEHCHGANPGDDRSERRSRSIEPMAKAGANQYAELV